MGTTAGNGTYRAAIYQAGQLATDVSAAGPPQLGVLFGSIAINDDARGLPLVWSASSTRKVATSQVTVNYSTDSITVLGSGSFPSGSDQLQVPAVARGLFLMASMDN